MENIHKKEGQTSNAYTIDDKIFIKFNTSWKQQKIIILDTNQTC